jgi:subfamily B ATP-binding cassette protein MsbA
MRRVSVNTQVELGQLTTLLNQNFQGARHVKAYGMEGYEEGRAGALFERIYGLVDHANRTRLRAGPMMEVLGGAAIALVIYYGGYEVIAGGRTPGTFFSFITALLLAYQPVKSLAVLNASLQEGLAAAQRVFEVLDLEPAIRDRPGARPLRVAGGEVRFERVRFGYHPGTVALDDVSFIAPAGSTLALVGPSGAGKSTIARLLYRFYDPTAGRITIDDQDIAEITQKSLRSAIGIVPQDTVLFNDTIGYNIAYGRGDATVQQIEAAAKGAAIDRFIAVLPEGYDSMVGERGLKLSGGEKQRVAIARTLLKNPPILVLDEATSALDSRTEQAIQETLDRVAESRTTIMIAHRLSTIVNADQIVVLDDGRVAERGTHDELLNRGGLYADLWYRQAAEQLAEDAVQAAE